LYCSLGLVKKIPFSDEQIQYFGLEFGVKLIMSGAIYSNIEYLGNFYQNLSFQIIERAILIYRP